MKKFGSIALFWVLASVASAQSDAWNSALENLTARNIGPVTMGGRITDLAIFEKDPRTYYAATASGGLFKTVNAGDSFTPVFDREGTISIGAAAVSQKNADIVWVGTGEATSRNSVAWGDGVYKSTDGGKTWANVGLKETHHIGDIVIDPRNDDVVYVAALGRLWGRNPERGVYKTTDGGKTWSQILKVDDVTGAIEISLNPKRPDELLVSMWQRERFAYDFVNGGPGSALYKTTNGGRNWKKITKGLPAGPIGRIGLDRWRKDPKVLVALVEFRDPSQTAGGGRMNGGGLFRSNDGGESWTQVNTNNPRPFYFSIPRIDPKNDQRVWIPAVNLQYSDDGGKTLKTNNNQVHPDYHAFWINPENTDHIIAGVDGGVFTTVDGGQFWRMNAGMAIGQYYAVGVDMRRPYWIYGGLQDNSNWGIPTQTGYGSVQYFHSVPLGGGDGFYNLADPNDWTTVYSESQGGAAYRTNLRTGETRSIRPRAPQGETYRFNWSTPFMLSPHNSRTIYLGGNKLFKSSNRGDAWTVISPDLTTNDPNKLQVGRKSVTPEDTGAERHCTITTISESPRKPGLLWVGTDDGLVQVTEDDGKTWTNVTANIPGLPANTWCSRVVASKYVDGRAYATFDGHRNNDFKSYVYVTEDMGKTWRPLHTSLPEGDSVYVIREGERNPDLLYLGSELSLRVSLDRGQNWTRYRTGNWPTVAVHDLVVHPVELDLVIGTHGRSIWTLDVSGLEQLTTAARDAAVSLFTPQDVLILGRTAGTQWAGNTPFATPNSQPGTRIQYWLKEDAKDVKLTISSADGSRSVDLRSPGTKKGLNAVPWNGRVEGRLAAGDYRVVLTVDGKEYVGAAKVVEAYLQ